ncbi:MAG: hypothetical protein ACFNMC_06880 [Veillonella parvula]
MVIQGRYGNGAERFERLQREGWDRWRFSGS